MDIQVMGGAVGVVCLGLASLATFILVPDRELTIKERLGIYTIFWTFAIYAMWTMYTIVPAQGWEKCFYVGIPFLLGLILTLISEYRSKQPPVEMTDARLKKIAMDTWDRLPNNVKRGLQNTIMNIKEVPQWSALDEEESMNVKVKAAKWFMILPIPARGIIHISKNDCEGLSDLVIRGVLAQEFARAYQYTRTPFDASAIDKAGEELPSRWNFKKEITELKRS